MKNVYVAHLDIVRRALIEAESWDSLKEGLKQSVRVQLDGVTDPQIAIGLALEIQTIEKIFHTMDALCEELTGAKNA